MPAKLATQEMEKVVLVTTCLFFLHYITLHDFIYGKIRKTSDFFGRLRTSSGIFGNDGVVFKNPSNSQDKNLTLIS